MFYRAFDSTQRRSLLPLPNHMKGNEMKFLKSMLLVAVLFPVFANSVALAQQSKTPVCHVTGSYDFGNGPVAIGHIITIADPALPSHMEHGDAVDYLLQTLPDGEAVCTPNRDSDGDGVPDTVDACDNLGALAILDSAGITYTITSDGCIVFSGTLPYYANLAGINLSGASFSGVNLNGLNITGANLSGADLSRTTGASTGGSAAINADGANLSGANFTTSYLFESSFINANLSDAIFDSAYLEKVDLTGADLTGTTFNRTWCPDDFITGDGGTCIGHLDF